jgi:hypothetical protein
MKSAAYRPLIGHFDAATSMRADHAASPAVNPPFPVTAATPALRWIALWQS